MGRLLLRRPVSAPPPVGYCVDSCGGYCAIGHTTYAERQMTVFHPIHILRVLFMMLALMCATHGIAHAVVNPDGSTSFRPGSPIGGLDITPFDSGDYVPGAAGAPIEGSASSSGSTASDDCPNRAWAEESIRRESLRNVALDASMRNATLGGYDPTKGLECLDRLTDLLTQIGDAIEGVANGFENPVVAVVTTLAAEILAQLFMQLVENVRSAICSAANQIYGFIDSYVKNAICIPSGRLPFDPFSPDLDLTNAKCEGWSIDMLTGEIHGTPVEGLNIPSNTISRAVSGAAADNQYMRTGQMPIAAQPGPISLLPTTPLPNGPAVDPGSMSNLVGAPVGQTGSGSANPTIRPGCDLTTGAGC